MPTCENFTLNWKVKFKIQNFPKTVFTIHKPLGEKLFITFTIKYTRFFQEQ